MLDAGGTERKRGAETHFFSRIFFAPTEIGIIKKNFKIKFKTWLFDSNYNA